jgi:hypothetical protein
VRRSVRRRTEQRSKCGSDEEREAPTPTSPAALADRCQARSISRSAIACSSRRDSSPPHQPAPP